jgi:MinD-like ATPase involved in chromosome partitioning or flagellar assembly
LPRQEFLDVRGPLVEAGYDAIPILSVEDLESVLANRRDLGAVILDGEADFDKAIEMYSLVRETNRDIATLMIVSPLSIDRLSLAGRARVNGEFVTRPYSAESLRWRVEAMLIRAETMLIRATAGADPTAAIIEAEAQMASSTPVRRGQIVVVFNPKGGVGKTTISVNLSAVMRIRRQQRVLLIDCDTVTGHITQSLGMGGMRPVAREWREAVETGERRPTFAELASTHSSGVNVLVMSDSPLHTEALEPPLVAEAIAAARHTFDWVVVDMHPDYGPLNQGIFALADSIIVPVTPDVPTIRAAVQFSQVAVELDIRERLSMVLNRANSGISGADIERVVAMPRIGRVRSAGMLFVRAANEGRAAVERFPEAKVVEDLDALAGTLIAAADARLGQIAVSSTGVRAFLGRLAGQTQGLPRLPMRAR